MLANTVKPLARALSKDGVAGLDELREYKVALYLVASSYYYIYVRV